MDVWLILILSVAVIELMVIVVFWFHLKTLKGKVKMNSESTKVSQKNSQDSKAKIGQINKEISELRNENEIIKSKIKKLETIKLEPENSTNYNDTGGQNNLIIDSEKSSKVSPLEIMGTLKNFYLPSPDSELTFYKPDATPKETSSSLYKFMLIDEKSGEFEVVNANSETLTLAFNSPETYLERVCTSGNSLIPSKHKNIVTINKGSFVIEEDNVKVTKKARIKYV